MRALGIFAVAATIALSGCAGNEDARAAKAEVARFRQQVAAGQFAEIYRASAPNIRNAMTEARFVQMVGDFHRSMGRFQSATEPSWRYDSGSDGDQIALKYVSTFERGKATQQFIYTMLDGRPVLSAYDYRAATGGPMAADAGTQAEDDGESEGS